MPVVSVKIDEETKKEMMKYKEKVDWPEAIREFIINRIEKIKREENLAEAEKYLTGLPSIQDGNSSETVNKDEGSN